MPKISVITSTHNRPDMLERAMRSVLSQTIEDFEYIIVDDSSESVEELVRSFNDDRIVYIKNVENPAKTHCRPLNEGIKASKGEFIAYLDDDNEFYPYHLEVLLNAFNNDPDLDVAYCDMMVHGPDATVHGIALDFDAQFLLNRNYIDTSEVMHKRQRIFDIGGWNEKVTRFTDWNTWVRMAKWGAKFQRVPIIALKYYAHGGDTQSKRTQVKSWFDPATGLTMFEPPFDPVGDYIFEGYLGANEEETKPKVAIMTKTYDRLEYTKRMYESLKKSTKYAFDWFVWDNGSTDGTTEWLQKQEAVVHFNKDNAGITKANNGLLDMIEREGDYQIIIHVDNDCEFMTKYWLESLVDLWRRNHMLYMSPYPEGLVDHPGGAPRIGHANIGPYSVEVTQHIGGLCAFIDAKAYDDFRWTDQFKHGNQDSEASLNFRFKGYMPCYIPLHRVYHIDTTAGQKQKYKEYFERRKKEKQEVA